MTTRTPHRRYIDPLDAVWLETARRIGLTVRRSDEAFAATDGRGTLVLGSRETLDPDDCVAQMVLHELCHTLVEGPDAFGRPDWGLGNAESPDLEREHACLRVQAALALRHGLRGLLAPTTEHRAFWDALPTDPMSDAAGASGVVLARAAVARAADPPWHPHLARALEATGRIAAALRGAAATHARDPDDPDRPSLWETVDGDPGVTSPDRG